jgi:hypothetical protein
MMTYDITVWLGSTAPIEWRFRDDAGELVDLTGMAFELSISDLFDSLLLRKKTVESNGLSVNLTDQILLWQPTLVESRLIPAGRRSKYEVEMRLAGGQEIFASGFVEGLGGTNADN